MYFMILLPFVCLPRGFHISWLILLNNSLFIIRPLLTLLNNSF